MLTNWKITHIIGPIFDSLVLLFGNSDFIDWIKLSISKRREMNERGTSKFRKRYWWRNVSEISMVESMRADSSTAILRSNSPHLENGVRYYHVDGTTFIIDYCLFVWWQYWLYFVRFSSVLCYYDSRCVLHLYLMVCYTYFYISASVSSIVFEMEVVHSLNLWTLALL